MGHALGAATVGGVSVGASPAQVPWGKEGPGRGRDKAPNVPAVATAPEQISVP